MDLGLRGRTALVTASSKGLGRATAIALAAEGANVVICGRTEEPLRATEAEIAGAGGTVAGLVADMNDPATPGRLVDATVERFGGLDILVANNGGPPPGTAMEVDDRMIEDAVNANLLASIRAVRAAVPHMEKARWGRICLITSVSVKEPIPGLALSNTARAGLWAWAKTAAGQLFEKGITLNLACPGLHATERIQQLGSTGSHIGDPADFGSVVAFLCSQHAGFVSGAALQIDGASVKGLL